MHELSIAQAVVGTVLDAVPGRRVERVRLAVGLLAGVVPQALTFAWDLAAAATPLEGSVLEVDRVPLEARCLECSAASSHTTAPPLTCPSCGGRALPTGDGRELQVVSVDVADEVPA